ncbi:MAG: arsenate reductase (glutaredoxin) [Pirellulaceae bacterium]|nr:arsenate reductase (glutaredoxin) [Pirellulaceae bacterium]
MVTIYHNPRCSKSRQTLALLEENGHTPTVIEYLNDPFTEENLKKILQKLGKGPLEILRKGDYKKLGLPPATTDAELLAQMVAHPKVIERPIVVSGEKAALGRPPEDVLEIL